MTSNFYEAFTKPEPQPRPYVVPAAPADVKPYAAKALSDELAVLARATPGHRNHQLNVSGFNLAQLVAGGYLDHDATYQALLTTALGIGLGEGESVATLRSAFGGGEAAPRVVADMGDVALPAATGYAPPVGEAHSDAVANDSDDPLNLDGRFPSIDWHALWADDTEDEWVLYPLLPARRLVALFSAPKVGKSLLMLEVAVAVSRGVTCLGTKPDRPYRVLYVDFENDPRGDVRSRLQAMHMTPYQLDNLHYLSYPQMAYLDTNVGGYELLAICQRKGIEVVVIDTISRAVGGEENDNDTWLSFYRNTGLLLKAAGITVVRLDHTGKDATKGMRGGSAKYGDVDAVWSLVAHSEQVFELECTANRLPIAEKVMVFRREFNPLRHVVDPAGRKAAYDAAVAALITAIANLDPVPPVDGWGSGYDKVWPRVRHHPQASKRVVEEALRRRKQAPTGSLYEVPDD